MYDFLRFIMYSNGKWLYYMYDDIKHVVCMMLYVICYVFGVISTEYAAHASQTIFFRLLER